MPAPISIAVSRLADLAGRELSSGWVVISQEAITAFAEATGDRQWIHLDADRARRESLYGTTIAHGFLTLSLISRLLRDAIHLKDVRLAVNYGTNKVRFPSAVPAGSRVRGRFTLARVDRVDEAYQATWTVIVEREGAEKPCCAAEWVIRYYP
jgi:acyl dehydratase